MGGNSGNNTTSGYSSQTTSGYNSQGDGYRQTSTTQSGGTPFQVSHTNDCECEFEAGSRSNVAVLFRGYLRLPVRCNVAAMVALLS